ncbi:MAG: gliding motility-associated C-terminal domain-containing protein, partial [Saprospiraceae bacterium]
ITNEINNCSAMASVVVSMNTTLPFADAGGDLELDCSNNMTLTLDGSNSSTGPNITYSWSSWNGNVTGDAGTLFPIVDGVGNYQLVVTDTTNGCIAISNMVVSLNTNYPTALAGNDTVITCAAATINLNGFTNSVGNNFSYEWETLDGNLIAGATTMTPTINAAGTYIFEVTNTNTFCATTDTVLVTLDVATPTADAGTDAILSCSANSLSLDGSASSTGSNFSYAWTTTNGNFLSGNNTLTPTIDAAGTYELTVTNLLNACSSVATVEVTTVFDLPTVEIATADLLSCANTTVVLDATGSSTGAEFNYLWTTTDGNIAAGATTLMPTVTAIGTYTLEVTNTTNACSEIATTTVMIDDQAPVADAGFDGSLACANTTSLLDGTNSSMGTEFSYLWTTTDGSIVSGETSLMPTVDELGTYTLVVTSALNGCTASDVVAVLLDTSLEPAMVGTDTSICVDSFLLIGNAPLGTTGFWTSSTGAIIEQADSSTTKVTGLTDGLNEFSYSLSTVDCADYSSATIQVTIAPPPTASDDVFELFSAGGIQTIDLIANDGLLSNDWELNLFNVPSNLTLENLQNGSVQLVPQQSGRFNFQYQLCNTACTNLCDTALVILELSNVDTSVTIPSGITPNDDGLNDLFIVKQIEETPFAFPNNELIIFNRWGTVVYQAKPYENNWGGKDNNGKALPAGTYYYVLRLDFAQGLVYKGDLSILR